MQLSLKAAGKWDFFPLKGHRSHVGLHYIIPFGQYGYAISLGYLGLSHNIHKTHNGHFFSFYCFPFGPLSNDKSLSGNVRLLWKSADFVLLGHVIKDLTVSIRRGLNSNISTRVP